jgi:lactoylglutathione lyase
MEEFRIALTAGKFDKTLSFYRDVVGLSVLQEWPSQEGRGVLFSLEKATLEIIDEAHATWVDSIEVGRRVSGPVRFAVKVSDIQSSLRSVVDAGIQILHEPVLTPWRDLNARIVGPDGMQVTLFSGPQ